MKPTSSTKHSTVTSLFQESYSLCQIQSKADLGKSTIGRIKKEVDGDKDNSKGEASSKLSSGQLFVKSPVEALWRPLISSTTPFKALKGVVNPITPQTVMNALKQSDFCAVVKMKCPLLKKAHRLIKHLKFARYHENWTVEDWERIL